MKNALATASILVLALAVFINVQTVSAQNDSTVFIKPDGSVKGTNQILKQADTYTLTGNLSGSIQIQRSNIILDGGGYTIEGNGSGSAFDLSNGSGADPSRARINNVTITNFCITNFAAGISCTNSKNNVFDNNYITGCDSGIFVIGSENNLITSNTFENNANAISIDYCKGTASVITKNNLINNDIIVWLSTAPVIERNYYSNYTAKYPEAKEINATGIWDTPYETGWAVDTQPLVHIIEANPIPEIPSWSVFPLILFTVLLTAFLKHKKRKV
ncbi:MAG: right-handed parallel beta-helix repeat-containing protein [Candidatus Bathyarchaeia archaeon]|jgi:parallel beta-helix repeat protein